MAETIVAAANSSKVEYGKFTVINILKKNKNDVAGIVNDLIRRNPRLHLHDEGSQFRFDLDDDHFNRGYHERIEIVQYKKGGKRTLSLKDLVYLGDDPWCEDHKFKEYHKKITMKKGTPLYNKLDEILHWDRIGTYSGAICF